MADEEPEAEVKTTSYQGHDVVRIVVKLGDEQITIHARGDYCRRVGVMLIEAAYNAQKSAGDD